jgi:hypothetical protein
MLTLNEIIEKLLTQYDADDILNILDISTEELLDKFDYKVADKYEELNEEFEDELT